MTIAKNSLSSLISRTALLLGVTFAASFATGDSMAESPFTADGDDNFGDFANSVPLEDGELDKLRGGFIDVNGAKIDFELVNRTIIDGVVRNEFSLSTENINQLSDINQNIIQVGNSNELAQLNDLVDISNIMTVVQNSNDGTLIQNLNELDITLQNFGEIQSNAALTNALGLNPIDGLR